MARQAESAQVAQTAIAHGTATPILVHQYGRQLLRAKNVKEAMAVFKANAKRFGEQWPTHVGLARGSAATGEKAKALEHAKKARAQAPDGIEPERDRRADRELKSEARRGDSVLAAE